MDWLYLIGRVLFAMIFLGSGFGHLTKVQPMAQYAASKGVPAPRFSVIVTGLMILAGGLSVLLGFWIEIGTWLLIIFLLLAGLRMHDFWAVTDPMEAQNQQAHFMKNLALAGAAMILYWMVQTQDTYGPFTLGQPMG